MNALQAAQTLVTALGLQYGDAVVRAVAGEVVLVRSGTTLKPEDLEQLEIPDDALGEGTVAG